MTAMPFCQLPAPFHMLHRHMRVLITAAPYDEPSTFVPAITHVYLYISGKQQPANWDGSVKFARLKIESLSVLKVCFVSVPFWWTTLGQIYWNNNKHLPHAGLFTAAECTITNEHIFFLSFFNWFIQVILWTMEINTWTATDVMCFKPWCWLNVEQIPLCQFFLPVMPRNQD